MLEGLGVVGNGISQVSRSVLELASPAQSRRTFERGWKALFTVVEKLVVLKHSWSAAPGRKAFGAFETDTIQTTCEAGRRSW